MRRTVFGLYRPAQADTSRSTSTRLIVASLRWPNVGKQLLLDDLRVPPDRARPLPGVVHEPLFGPRLERHLAAPRADPAALIASLQLGALPLRRLILDLERAGVLLAVRVAQHHVVADGLAVLEGADPDRHQRKGHASDAGHLGCQTPRNDVRNGPGPRRTAHDHLVRLSTHRLRQCENASMAQHRSRLAPDQGKRSRGAC